MGRGGGIGGGSGMGGNSGIGGNSGTGGGPGGLGAPTGSNSLSYADEGMRALTALRKGSKQTGAPAMPSIMEREIWLPGTWAEHSI